MHGGMGTHVFNVQTICFQLEQNDSWWKVLGSVGYLHVFWCSQYRNRCGDVSVAASNCLASADDDKSENWLESDFPYGEHVSDEHLSVLDLSLLNKVLEEYSLRFCVSLPSTLLICLPMSHSIQVSLLVFQLIHNDPSGFVLREHWQVLHLLSYSDSNQMNLSNVTLVNVMIWTNAEPGVYLIAACLLSLHSLFGSAFNKMKSKCLRNPPPSHSHQLSTINNCARVNQYTPHVRASQHNHPPDARQIDTSSRTRLPPHRGLYGTTSLSQPPPHNRSHDPSQILNHQHP